MAAVSGGVDSMALLDLLVRQVASRRSLVTSDKRPGAKDSTTGYRFVVAHFDHGIRPDSQLDRQLVQAAADKYGLPFVYDRAQLGPGASEAAARRARYAFLRRVARAADATAIVTAHHQDDLLETAIHNLLRGTGRKGLTALASTGDIMRPLLDVPKRTLLKYAEDHKLNWREDATNQDLNYRRNYIRRRIVPRLGADGRRELLGIIKRLRIVNVEIDQQIANLLRSIDGKTGLNRHAFIMLPHRLAREAMAAWLRNNQARDFDRRALERLTRDAKVLASGKQSDVAGDLKLVIGEKYIKLKPTDR